jgi:putative SOS response-associated peptidase YedK
LLIASDIEELAMCGRISQHVDGRIYMEALRFPAPPADDSDYAPGAPLYNIAATTTPRVIAIADGRPIMLREQWGRKGKRLYFTARLETAATSGYWNRAWRDNRIVLAVTAGTSGSEKSPTTSRTLSGAQTARRR